MHFQKYKFISVLIGFLFLLGSCVNIEDISANSQEYKSKIERKSVKKTANIIYKDGLIQKARSIRFEMDSLAYTVPGDSSHRIVPLSELKSIRFYNRTAGMLGGAGLMLLVGSGTGALIGYSLGNDKGYPTFLSMTAEQKAGLGAGIGSLLGILVGIPGGYVVGSPTDYKISAIRSDSAKSTVPKRQQ